MQSAPEERKVSEEEVERRDQGHEEDHAASSYNRAQRGPECHSGNKSHSSSAKEEAEKT